MSQLKLRLLGPPEVEANGIGLSFPSRKSLALLLYLAVENGMHPRERLAALLWPESDPTRARATLRNGLHQLRSALPEEGFLLVERDALGFNFEADYRLDLDVVRGAVDGSPSLESLQGALDLYRGNFLEGFSPGGAAPFDDWIAAQRTRWQRYRNDLFDRLSQRYFERGRIGRARAAVAEWLAHDPLNEKAYRRLMRIHMAGGNWAAGLQAYERCRATLAEELDVAPAPETRALAERLRRKIPVSSERLSGDEDRDRVWVGPNEPSHGFASGPMVGRSEAFGALVAAYYRAGAGEPQLATVIGEAGIGKTRLCSEFLAWAQAHGADLLRGQGLESGQQLPYQPLVDALRSRVEAINAPEDYLSDTWLAELSRLLPELLDRYPDLAPARLEKTAAGTRLFEAIARLTLSLAERAAGSPLILFLDDLQWADSASLDVLQYAGRRWQESNAPVLLLIAAREEALDPRSAAHAPRLVECRDGLARRLGTTPAVLKHLSLEDTTQFLAGLGAGEVGGFAQWLFRETGGQPFFLVETLEDLRDRGLVNTGVNDAGGRQLKMALPERGNANRLLSTPIPEKVRRMIAGRLARLTPPAFEMLAAGAILGRGLTFNLLCRVAGAEEGPGLRALDELLRSRLLQEREPAARVVAETGSPHYDFSHDKIRDVAYAEAGAARRRVFHRRALAALTESGEPEGRLVRHALGAGKIMAGFRHALAAGDQSLALFAAQNAISHYEQAGALVEQLPVESRQLKRLYLQLGRARELVGDYDGALMAYDKLEAVARRREDSILELAALMARTTVYAAPTEHYDPDHVRVLTDRALPLARRLNDHAAESRIQWNLMLLRLFTGEIGEAVAAGEAALAIARRHDLRERMAYALHDLTRAYLFSGRAEAGLDAAEEARALWRELNNKAMLVDNLISAASARFFWQGSTEPIIPQLEEALTLSLEIDNRWTESYAHHILGSVYYDLGRYGLAIESSRRAIELGREAGFTVPLFINGSALAMIYGTVGRPELGEPWIEKALEEGTGSEDQEAAPLAARAFLHVCRGDLDAAAENIRRSRECVEPDSLSAGVFFTYPVDGMLQLARGEYERALAVGQQLIDHLRRTGLRFFWADGFFIRGRALLALGRLNEAHNLLQRAEEIATATTSRRILWEIAAAQAELARARGREEEASAAARRAAELVWYIARHLDDEELSRSFLKRPAIRAIQNRIE